MIPHAAPLEHHPVSRLDPRRIRRALGRAAPVETDDFLAFIDRQLVERASEIRIEPKRILELARVPGHAARLLQAQYPDAWVTSLGLAKPHAEGHSLRASPEQRLPMILVGDPVRLPFPADCFDLVIANLTLHWSADALRAVKELRRVLKPGAPLLLATMGPATLGECRTILAEIDLAHHGRVWTRIQEFHSLPDLGDLLGIAGLSRAVVDREMLKPRFADVESLLYELRRIGATNAQRQRPAGLMGKGTIRELEQRYRQQYGNVQDQTVPVTLEILFGHAWKSSSVAVDRHQPIS
ncbi:MAG: methyltransferase domain-containing protein [Magnetococcus sp. YQC-9]